MTPKRRPREDPVEWLNRARSNLTHARGVSPGVYLEDLCFDAQQCAEKAIKAVFIGRGESFPYVHDLKKLMTQLKSNGQRVPQYMWTADELTPYASATRYPDKYKPITKRQYRKAVRLAMMALDWAERQVAAETKGP